MKKLTNISLSKILLISGVGLITTIAGFAHHQWNQNHLSTIHVLNQGLGTCFGRINQSFTALMIKDVKSPYLDKGFTQLTNACIEELKATFKPLETKMPMLGESINKLNSETTWFHEKLAKIHSPMLLGQGLDGNLTPIKDRYITIEELKVSLTDEFDAGMHRLKQIQFSDEVIMGAGLLLFILGLGLMTVQEMSRMRKRSEAEKMAIGLIKNNQANVGAMVDALVSKALADQGLVVTAQIFKDYHESLLEGMHKQTIDTELKIETTHTIVEDQQPNVENKTSLNDIVLSLKNLNLSFDVKEIVDADLKVEAEECFQLISTAIHKLNDRKNGNHQVMLNSDAQGDKCIVHLFLENAAFNSEELEAANDLTKLADPYLMILSEMVKESGISWSYGNQISEKTQQLGMYMSFHIPKEPKPKNLVSVVKGKKRDIARSLAN